MPTPVGGSLRLRRSLWLHLTAAAVCSGGLAAYVVSPIWAAQPLYATTNALAIVAFAVTAVLLAHEGGQAGNARLFVGCAACWAIGLVGRLQAGPLPLLEETFGPLLFVFVSAVLLRYPLARLRPAPERVFVIALLAWLLTGTMLWEITSYPTWWGYTSAAWWPALFPGRRVNQLVALTLYVGAAFLAVVFVVLLILRLRRARGIDRRVLTPVIVAASAIAAAGAVNALARLVPNNQSILTSVVVFQAFAVTVIPFAFLVAAVGRRLARASVADMLVRVGRSTTTEVVRAELRRTLHDPTLEIFYWVPETEAYVDATGRFASVDPAAADRFLVPVEATDGQQLAIMAADPSLARHRDLVDAAVAASALALENARLQARILAQLEQVRASRARIVEVGLAERRRLERDLHDGAQQRLLALAMQLATVPAHTTDPVVLTAITEARGELREALQELRDLARGIHPAILTQAGLASALESVAERLPLNVDLHVPRQRWDPAVESTIYFLVCEALTNTVKHAEATIARIEVRPQGHELRVTVTDDGRGGTAFDGGSGLMGLLDRVTAIGGQLTVSSSPESGTELTARIPCE